MLVAVIASGCDDAVPDGSTASVPAPAVVSGPGWFTDVAAQSRLVFEHTTGATGAFYFPEIAGSGCGLFDYDGDGDLDVYLLGQLGWGNRLYRNDLIETGAKTFTEQYILSRLMSDRLEAAGQRVEVRDSLGSTVVFNALASGEIDAYVDYTGTIWANYMKRTNAPGRTRVLSELASWLDQTHGILLLGPLGFENAYALAMRADRADALGIRSLEDLAPRTPELEVGGDYEFFARPEWRAVRDRYGFRFARQRTFDSTLMYRAVVSGHVDVISAFSSDGRIEAFDLRVLSDPLGVFPPYDAVLLLSPEAREREALLEALRPLVDGIDDDAMRRANKMVDVDKRTIGQAALALDDEIRSAADDDPT